MWSLWSLPARKFNAGHARPRSRPRRQCLQRLMRAKSLLRQSRPGRLFAAKAGSRLFRLSLSAPFAANAIKFPKNWRARRSSAESAANRPGHHPGIEKTISPRAQTAKKGPLENAGVRILSRYLSGTAFCLTYSSTTERREPPPMWWNASAYWTPCLWPRARRRSRMNSLM
jgi:hypothetical protein